MVDGYLEHLADFILLPHVCQGEFRVLYALFGLRVEDLHSSEIHGSMAHGRGSHAIDSHFGQKGGEVFRLDLRTLLCCEACGTKWVLYHHLPDCPETNPNIFPSKCGCFDAPLHFGGLLDAVREFIVVISVRCKSHAKGAHAGCCADTLDGGGIVKVGAGVEEDRWAVSGVDHFWFASGCELPFDAVPETFGQVQCASSCM